MVSDGSDSSALNRNRVQTRTVVMNRFSIPSLGLAALLALTACSSSGGGNSNSVTPPASQPASTSQAPPASGPTITIKNFGYTVALSVPPATKVTVVNQDSAAHTLTDKATNKFDTGSISGGGGTGSFTAPDKPGSYPFGCTFHPDMHGTLKVTG
jgi:plastocyanin